MWALLHKFDADWTDQKVVRLKDFFLNMPGHKGKANNCSRVVQENRKDWRFYWRVNIDYYQATTRAEGRSPQGGAGQPYMVKKASLWHYYRSL